MRIPTAVRTSQSQSQPQSQSATSATTTTSHFLAAIFQRALRFSSFFLCVGCAPFFFEAMQNNVLYVAINVRFSTFQPTHPLPLQSDDIPFPFPIPIPPPTPSHFHSHSHLQWQRAYAMLYAVILAPILSGSQRAYLHLCACVCVSGVSLCVPTDNLPKFVLCSHTSIFPEVNTLQFPQKTCKYCNLLHFGRTTKYFLEIP